MVAVELKATNWPLLLAAIVGCELASLAVALPSFGTVTKTVEAVQLPATPAQVFRK